MRESRQLENVALVGFMGTGKSSVAHAVAALLHFQMIDTDELVERRAHKRVSEIFRDEGEPKFREHEREVIADLAALRRVVIATGGGVAADPANLASLKKHALVVCLWATADAIWERVRHQSHRPLLNDPNPLAKIKTLLAQREPYYRQADVLVNTELRSVREVALQVVHQFRLAHHSSGRENNVATPGAGTGI